MKEIIAKILRVACPIERLLAEEDDHVIKKGKRGGKYYINDEGEKVYVHDEDTPNNKDTSKPDTNYSEDEQKQIDDAIKNKDPDKAMEVLKNKLSEDEYKELEGLRDQYKNELKDAETEIRDLKNGKTPDPDKEDGEEFVEDEETEETEEEEGGRLQQRLKDLETKYGDKKEKAKDAVKDAFSDMLKDLIGPDLSKILFK